MLFVETEVVQSIVLVVVVGMEVSDFGELRSTSEGREVLSGVEDLPLLLHRLLLWDLPAPVLDDFMLLSSPLCLYSYIVVVLPMVYNFEGVPASSSSLTALAITLEIESSEKIVLDFTNSQWFCLIRKKIIAIMSFD